MLLNNILLGIIIFFLSLIFGSLVNIDKKLSDEEYKRMNKFYNSLLESIKNKRIENK